MKRRRHSVAQAIRKLREAEAAIAGGATIPQVCKRMRISAATFHRWRQQHAGTRPASTGRPRHDGTRDEVLQRLRQSEKENKRLKQLVAELTLENAFLKDTLEGR